MENTSIGGNLEAEYFVEKNSMDDFKDLDLGENFVDTNSVESLSDLEFSEKEKYEPIKSSLNMGSREPCIGLVFEELEDAMSCYKAYAKKKGFSIRKSRNRRSRTDHSMIIGVEFSCYREGFRRPSYHKKHKNVAHRSETMIGCKAMMSVRRDKEKWVVSKFVDEHNHEFCSPKSTVLLRGHRGITLAQKNLINVLNDAGVPPRQIVSVLVHQAGVGTPVGCMKMDVQNFLGNKRRKLLKEGDAQRMYNYFRTCQSNNPGFVYAIQVDQNNCMGNCFWADTRSRLACQYFGDVVTFDATYLTNRYSMPFVPFTGVNHHHQSIMFGCALLVNETAESYIWLLQTWVEAMCGHTPSVIITDDDKAMAKAIAEVLPNTTHRLCMWHILQKVPEHLAHVFNKYPSFQGEFHHCIHDTITVDQFEVEWNQLIFKYELTENDWLRDLYRRREKWIPAYLRTMFCAGMSTTQRSESMNKFFKDFVHSSMLVSDFVFQYEKALDKRYQSEKEKDVKTRTTRAILKTCYKMEAQAAEVYTRKIFAFFQEELFLSQKQSLAKFREEGTTKVYKVMADEKENVVYEVALDLVEKKASCSCHKFEFIGILCRHILALFVKKSLISHLPQHYILPRWTINAKSHVNNEISSALMSQVMLQQGTKSSSAFTEHSLIIEALKVVGEGQKSKKKHEHLAVALQKVHNELLAMKDDDDGEIDVDDGGEIDVGSGSAPLVNGTQLLSNITFTLNDPPHVASKGRPKSLRQKHPNENPVGKKRKCSICKQPGHNRTSCHVQKQVGDNVGGTSSSPVGLNLSTNQHLHEANMDLQTPIMVSQDPKCSTFMGLMMEATYNSSF